MYPQPGSKPWQEHQRPAEATLQALNLKSSGAASRRWNLDEAEATADDATCPMSDGDDARQ